MSPNEFQLRTALRDGEGENVNPDTVIARVRGMQQARHDRRVRYASVAAVVAVVGGIGVVGSVLLNRGGNQTSTAAKGGGETSDRDAQKGNKAAGSNPGQPAAPGPMADAAAIACPARVPNLLLPGGGGTGQFGAQGPLFSGPVEAVKVCAYARAASGVAPSTALTGQNAINLATSMEESAKAFPASIRCPAGPAATDRGALVIIGLDTHGKQMKPVVVTLNCPNRVTNGTALRYNWTPPASITKLITERVTTVPGTGPISLPPGGRVTGSPIQS